MLSIDNGWMMSGWMDRRDRIIGRQTAELVRRNRFCLGQESKDFQEELTILK